MNLTPQHHMILRVNKSPQYIIYDLLNTPQNIYLILNRHSPQFLFPHHITSCHTTSCHTTSRHTTSRHSWTYLWCCRLRWQEV